MQYTGAAFYDEATLLGGGFFGGRSSLTGRFFQWAFSFGGAASFGKGRSRAKQRGEATESVSDMWTNERKRAVLFRRKLCGDAGKGIYCADCLNFIAKGE